MTPVSVICGTEAELYAPVLSEKIRNRKRRIRIKLIAIRIKRFKVISRIRDTSSTLFLDFLYSSKRKKNLDITISRYSEQNNFASS